MRAMVSAGAIGGPTTIEATTGSSLDEERERREQREEQRERTRTDEERAANGCPAAALTTRRRTRRCGGSSSSRRRRRLARASQCQPAPALRRARSADIPVRRCAAAVHAPTSTLLLPPRFCAIATG